MSHAKLFQPSKADIWVNCPMAAHLLAEEKWVPNEAATRGSILHGICEARLRDRDLTPKVGEEFAAEGFNIIITQDDMHSVNTYVETIEGILGFKSYEKRVCLPWIHEDLFGTADTIIKRPGELEVWDYKSGKTEVPITTAQLKIYALGALGEMNLDMVDTVTVGVVQPQGYPPVKSHTYTADELYDWADDVLIPAVQRTLEKVPGSPGEHCRWCTGCSALKGMLETTAVEAFAAAPPVTAGDIKAIKASMPKFADMDFKAAMQIAVLSTTLTNWIADIRKGCISHLHETGEDAFGYKCVRFKGGAKEDWVESDKAIETLRPILGDDCLKVGIKSVSAVRKMLKEEDIEESILNEFVKDRISKTLAHIEDGRDKLIASDIKTEKAIEAFSAQEVKND